MAGGAAGIRAGRAFVELGIDDSGVQNALNRVSARFKAMGSVLSNAGAWLTGTGALITAPLIAAAHAAAESGAAIYDMSKRTGASVEFLSKLGYAADHTGTDLGMTEQALRKMQRTIAGVKDDVEGTTGELGHLGIRMDEIRGLPVDKQFELIASKIALIQGPTDKANAAMKVFGRSGTLLVPLMDQLGDLGEEAKSLGYVRTAQSALEMKQFSIAMLDATKASKSLWSALGVAIIPTLKAQTVLITNVVLQLRDWARAHKPLVDQIFRVGIALTTIGTGLVFTGLALNVAGAAIGGLLGPVKLAGTVLGFLASPLGLIGGLAKASFGLLVRSALAMPGALLPLGRGIVMLGAPFKVLGGVASGVFGGIARVAMTAGGVLPGVVSSMYELATSAIGVVGTVTRVLGQSFMTVGRLGISAFGSIVAATPGMIGALSRVTSTVGAIGKEFAGVLLKIPGIAGVVANMGGGLTRGLAAVGGVAKGAFSAVSGAAVAAAGVAASYMGTALSFVGGIVGEVASVAAGVVGTVASAIAGLAAPVVSAVGGMLATGLSAVAGFATATASTIAGLFPVTLGVVGGILTSVGGAVTAALGGLATMAGGALTSIAGTAAAATTAVLGSIAAMAAPLAAAAAPWLLIGAAIATIGYIAYRNFGMVKNAAASVADGVLTAFQAAGTILSTAFDTAASAASGAFASLSSLAARVFGSVRGYAATAGSQIAGVMETVWGKLKSGWATVYADATSAFDGIKDAIMSGNWSLAGQIIWTTLKLEVQRGLQGIWDPLIGQFLDVKDQIVMAWTGMSIAIVKIFAQVSAQVKGMWNAMIGTVASAMTGLFIDDAEMQKRADKIRAGAEKLNKDANAADQAGDHPRAEQLREDAHVQLQNAAKEDPKAAKLAAVQMVQRMTQDDQTGIDGGLRAKLDQIAKEQADLDKKRAETQKHSTVDPARQAGIDAMAKELERLKGEATAEQARPHAQTVVEKVLGQNRPDSAATEQAMKASQTAGTFNSSALFGLGGSGPMAQTAKNTGKTVEQLQDMAKLMAKLALAGAVPLFT